MGEEVHALTPTPRGILRAVMILVLVGGFVLPIIAGLSGTLLAAFDHMPSIGANGFDLSAWRTLFGMPGLGTSLGLTVSVGLLATGLAFVLAVGFCASVHGRVRIPAAERMLAPLLASPHSAIAIGLTFVLAPSGWIARIFSPWATGWTLPPDVITVHDPFGIALIVGLLVKEVPFLLLVILAALNQVPVRAHLRAGRSLGYGSGIVWIKVILPQVYPQIRAPLYIVLSFSLSVVDMALILGPGNPPTLSVIAMRWFMAPDTNLLPPASAAAVLQLLIVVCGVGAWRLAETGFVAIGRWWVRRGGRGVAGEPGLKIASAVVLVLFVAGGGALLSMAIWSVTWRWTFPHLLPESWGIINWKQQIQALRVPAGNTILLGLVTTLSSLVLAIAWFESTGADQRTARSILLLTIYLPLLLPQIGFLYGVQVLLLRAGLDGSLLAVAAAQMLFVFPYVLMALRDPWNALDPRYARAAAALGASPWRILVAVKLPILLRPILVALAIGFSVSVAQYLPTLFTGAGRVATLTTEAVTLSSGADRRVIGIYAVVQTILPLLVYGGALAIPSLVFARRRDLAGAGS
jgi:putative thiamine transport system permease protein